jgi:predicted nuclease with TOPRIM domain
MTKQTFFGLTTVFELKKAQNESDNWRLFYLEANETIERFQQENNQLKKDLENLETKHKALKQELKERNIWVEHLEGVNKEQVALIEKQQASLTKALDEAAQTAMLRNEATVKLAQQKTAIRIAIDNFNLATKDI